VIWRSPSLAPCCSLHGWEDNVRIHNLDTVVCQPCLAQCPVSVLPNSEAVLSLLGCNLLSGGETALTRCVCTIAAHALARLLQAIITRAAP
jgi:hypothetical protein